MRCTVYRPKPHAQHIKPHAQHIIYIPMKNKIWYLTKAVHTITLIRDSGLIHPNICLTILHIQLTACLPTHNIGLLAVGKATEEEEARDPVLRRYRHRRHSHHQNAQEYEAVLRLGGRGVVKFENL